MRVSYGSKKPLIIRLVFIVSAFILVSFSALLVAKGLTQLKNGVIQLYDSSVVRTKSMLVACKGLARCFVASFSPSPVSILTARTQEANRILADIDEFATAVENIGQIAAPLRDELVSKLANDSFCPGVDLLSLTGVDFSSYIDESVAYLEQLGNFTAAQGNNTRNILETAQQTAETVETTSDNITPRDWQSLMFVVPFSIFAVLFLAGVALAWSDRAMPWYRSILTWFVLPIFIILIVICFLLSGGIAIAASMNAGKIIELDSLVYCCVSLWFTPHVISSRFLFWWRGKDARRINCRYYGLEWLYNGGLGLSSSHLLHRSESTRGMLSRLCTEDACMLTIFFCR